MRNPSGDRLEAAPAGYGRPGSPRRPTADGPTADTGTADRPEVLVLEASLWRERESRHHDEVDELIGAHRARVAHGAHHPVEDFLFTYYSFRPAQLRRWHPGAGVALVDAGERARWRFHHTVFLSGAMDCPVVTADPTAFAAARADTIRFVSDLLGATATSAPQFGCFGLHEWAMVYRSDARRHLDWPLRLGQQATDEVVRRNQIRCTHFDAHRFFTPEAQPRNFLQPRQDTRTSFEQPGCLHAAMDLYKWAYRLTPIVDSDLVLDCFRLAREVRAVDMRASPYDLTEIGYRPIAIETAAGKAEYVAAQRDFAGRAQRLRSRLLHTISTAFAGGSAVGAERDVPGGSVLGTPTA